MSASEFLELHLSPDSALEPEHQRECEHYMDDYAASEAKRIAEPLMEVMKNVQSLLHFYGKREMENPANHQEFVRETRDKLDRFDAALATARAELEGR